VKNFEIISVATGADVEYPQGTASSPVLAKWTDILVRVNAEFDWEKDSLALLGKLRAATELDS
jgi:hypothetical protein